MRVLITGASGGLGRAFAIACAKRGYALFLTDVGEESLRAIAEGLKRRFNADVMVKACDLTDAGEVIKLVEVVKNSGEALSMLFNVAGIDFEGGFLSRDAGAISNIVRLNIEATLFLTHQVLKSREGKDPFYLVFVSSLASISPMPLKATYAASKRFLLDFSYALGQELKEENVSALSLCPGGLPTTKSSIDGILAQGVWGRITTNRVERIAGRTIDKALKGRRIYIPGVVNRAFSKLERLLPKALSAKVVYLRWKKAQKRWLKEDLTLAKGKKNAAV